MREIVQTDKAPEAIGTYSQGVVHGDTLYISGQIPLVPGSMEIVSDDIDDQIQQVFKNLNAVAQAAGTELSRALKFTVYLKDLSHFPKVNAIMAEHMKEPYPARAAFEVSALPREALVEIDAVVALSD